MPEAIVEVIKSKQVEVNTKINDLANYFEKVVISGMSGRFPSSDNVEEFKQNLMNKVDMVTDSSLRWPPGFFGLPKRCGIIKDVSKFDASFFGVHPKQAARMDPQIRMLLETTYEAIVDSGVNPALLRGTRTGVFIGNSASESHDGWSNDLPKLTGYEMSGCTRSMFANRLSYFFDFKGPSYTADSACSSGLLVLDQALHAIRTGLCDAAIVGACNLCLRPATSAQFQKLSMLASYGACRSFDASGYGYCRSESVVVIFIQKEKDAKRVYASLVHSKNNSDGFKEQGITYPSGEMQKRLLLEVYEEAHVNPTEVSYVELHGTGTKAGDPEEANAAADVFCTKERKGSLLIGSTKSNSGHPEPASGLVGLVKVLISMHGGIIPPNLHYDQPNENIPGLIDGRLKVVTEPTKWDGGLAAISSFGFGGTNVHLLLQSFKPSSSNSIDVRQSNDSKARLVTCCARTKQGAELVLKKAVEFQDNVAAQALLQDSFGNLPLNSHPYRGSVIINSISPLAAPSKTPSEKRPVWFIFAGMGTQWDGMGRDLLCINSFRRSIMKSHQLLEQFDIHLLDMILSAEHDTYKDTIKSFVGIAAIQVALVDVLKELKIEADGFIGHSVGELGCAYADGGLTAEETLLAAYWRGKCVSEGKLPPGKMAAVGLSWSEVTQRCPDGVVPACHNSADTVTISGPEDVVTAFVNQLQSEGVFAKEVKSAGVAFHSKYMAHIAPQLQHKLSEVVIQVKRARSPKWISSSIPESRWSSDLALYSSAEYHVNNLISPVLFQEALQKVPSNAITIEIASHCLLQAILKRSLSADCSFIGLMNRTQPDNLAFFLNSLARLYRCGVDFDPFDLKPGDRPRYPIDYSVPSFSSLITWDHATQWDVPTYEDFTRSSSSSSAASEAFVFELSPDSEDAYLFGHKIDGRVLFPATGYLVLAWKTIAKFHGRSFDQLPVTFRDVHIHRATILPSAGEVRLDVCMTPSSGYFEVSESSSLVVSGHVMAADETALNDFFDETSLLSSMQSTSTLSLKTTDIYKELKLRGYEYGDVFKGIVSTDESGEVGELAWFDNWISFLDTMLQMQVVGLSERDLRLPTRIQSIQINPLIHINKVITKEDGSKVIPVRFDKQLNSCTSGCVEVLGLHATVAPRRPPGQVDPVLMTYSFVPYHQDHLHHPENFTNAINKCKHFAKEKISCLLTRPDINEKKKLMLQSLMEKNEDDIINGYDGDSFKNDATSDYGLYELLMRVFSPNSENLVTKSELHRNHIFGLLRRTQPLINIVVENSPSEKKLMFMELDAADGCVFQSVIPRLNNEPGLKFKYFVSGSAVENIDKQLFDDLNLEALQWNIGSKANDKIQGKVDALILGDVLNKQKNISEYLSACSTLLRDEGFILVYEPTRNFGLAWLLLRASDSLYMHAEEQTASSFCSTKEWLQIFAEANFNVVSHVSDGYLHTAFLLRKKTSLKVTDEQIKWIDVTNNTYQWVEIVKRFLSDAKTTRLWLRGSEVNSGVVGLATCLRREPDGEKIRCLLNCSPEMNARDVDELLQNDLFMNVYRGGLCGSFKHLPLERGLYNEIETEAAYVNVLTRGDLSSLRWIESPLKFFDPSLDPAKQLCTVHFTSLNFRDIMLATGKLPPDAIPGDLASQDCLLGMEFSGVNQRGESVMGLLQAKGLATVVDVHEKFLWKVPDGWTLEQASTVPVAYSTAYYALVIRGRVKKNESVLIHSGSGAVGQAAISIALHCGCKVFTTVGSAEKRNYLMKRFPQLTDSNFADSRSSNFWRTILKNTGGRGVDVVLNSLAEDKLQSSVRLLAQHGRFLEIGKFDLSNDSALGMSIFLRNISFHGILLDALFSGSCCEWDEVSKLMVDGMASGVVVPLQTTVFERDAIESAFRYMAQGKHIGKVVIRQLRTPAATAIKSSTKSYKIKAISRVTCHPQKLYLIVGGLGGFGIELCQWLVDRGARKLVITSRSGIKSGFQKRRIEQWKSKGVDVQVSTRNVSDKKQTELLISECLQNASGIGGIFNLAMVIQDSLISNQTPEKFEQVAEPKVVGTINLDIETRRQCNSKTDSSKLDWFVTFSSVSSGKGNPGQSNYGWANSTMERICEERVRHGYPGLAIQWGAVGDVGIVAESMGDDVVIGGTLPQKITSCLSTLDKFLEQPNPVVSSFVLASHKKTKVQSANKIGLKESVARILGVKDVSLLPPDQTLGDLGLDSLMSVEVKQTLERDYDLTLPIKEIRLLSFGLLDKLADQPSSAQTPTVDNSPLLYTINDLLPKDRIVYMSDPHVNRSKPPLFVIPPIEGSVVLLKPLTLKFDCPVYGLQCTSDLPLTSVEELAKYYVETIKSLQAVGPYQILGYSFGACIAVEVALQLQRDASAAAGGCRMILLDGSHSYVLSMIASYSDSLGSGDQNELETTMICAFVDHIVRRVGSRETKEIDIPELGTKLVNKPDLESRLDLMCEVLRDAGKIASSSDADAFKQANRIFYKKLMISHRYKPSSKIENAVVHLIRAQGSSAKHDEDYGMRAICSQALNIYVVEGTHDTFFKNAGEEKVAKIIKDCLM
ncbi:hypothetical protein HELRODRAFT_99033 [Helobdella robusta]|uniref:Fatty acid synthase n=1 Tax=Helobdella robusta TaxID=6412 RepID=T1G9Q6_HELRO|nr:hypothetical protein HELRODRAFT_99033 [Helobdella robusta]ESO05744.1 hypothetical protein HELRODRAFT_99033 [Helobdella robusta]